MNQRQILEAAADRLAAAGVQEAAGDAWLMMSEAFSISRTDYYMHCDDECDCSGSEQYSLFESMVDRRCRREPLQYILGKSYFMGYEFKVTPDVLIPRFDTEILVEESLKYIKSGDRILDMCTGSGCIAVSVMLEWNRKQKSASEDTRIVVDAVDISDAALAVARKNAAKLGAEQVNFISGDMFENTKGQYNVILSNPPYIPTEDIKELEPEVKDCEPVTALDGTEDGLFFYRILAGESGKHLHSGGYLLMEIGYNQAEAVSLLLEENNFADIKVVKDLAGLDRVVCGRRI